jgi:uncharacterized protein
MGGPSTHLRLRVIPRPGKPGIVGRYGDAWKVRVSAPPKRGQANEATLDLLADTLGLPAANVRLVSGHGSRDKTVEVAGITTAEAERRLAQ